MKFGTVKFYMEKDTHISVINKLNYKNNDHTHYHAFDISVIIAFFDNITRNISADILTGLVIIYLQPT